MSDERPVVPGEENPKRQQILDGARQMFLSKGFEGASMQDIASAAKVSKGTLYVYFDNKETMFEALVTEECSRLQETVRRIGTGTGSVEQELREIARQMLETLLRPQILAAIRVMIGAGEKFPELARKIYEAGPARSATTIGDYLQLRAARGDLHVENCAAAGSLFVDMVLTGLQRRALLMMPPLAPAALEDYLATRVALFVAGHAPR
ncbi:TetR/AcrR family transcriptional regulator [Paracoccus ravus]|uniref:TetR/AcrR family transcriptional regulator n=1 Tax=Paracoccus ravus TaxID=2447760 RepID=UPI00106E18F6|nr:TetR/AcrR family transcriptional regulator [Paracoccus ravus]